MSGGAYSSMSFYCIRDTANACIRSNSNGTYYGLSVEYVNRNSAGYVDFEKVSEFVLIPLSATDFFFGT